MQSDSGLYGIPKKGGLSRSEVWVYNANNDSGATTNRTFSTIQVYTGSAIVYYPSTTLGDIFQVTENGIYSISYTDCWGSSTAHGISLNAPSLSLSILAEAAPNALAIANAAVNEPGCASVTLFLAAGSILRANTQGAPNGTYSTLANFHITKIAA